MNQEALRAFHIAKANQDGPILRDVSLSVRRQCCVGIAGPNESGKSLLLRILAGQESFDSGYLAINGQAVAPQKAEARRDVMLIQRKQSLVKSLSVADNLLMNRPHASKPHLAWGRQLNRQAQGILEEFGLRFDPGAHVGDLTSGQCMQVELLRCHLLGAGIILIDDICREELHSELPAIAHLLRSMQRKGKTFVVTGILPEELWTFCDAVMSLRAGLCLRSGWARVGAHGEGARQPSPRAEAAPAPDTREAVFCAERLMLPSGASLSLTLRRGEIVGLVDAYVKHHMALLERLAHLPRDGALMRSLLPQPCPRRRRNRLPIAVIGRDSRSYVVENTSMFENAVLPSYPRLAHLGILGPKTLSHVRNDFAAWSGMDVQETALPCQRISIDRRLAVLFYRAKLQGAQVLFFHARYPEWDAACRERINAYLRKLAQEGMAVCILLTDTYYRDLPAERYLYYYTDEMGAPGPYSER